MVSSENASTPADLPLQSAQASETIGAIPVGITRQDVEEAIRDFDGGVGHAFGSSTFYDLLYEGRRYPPKAVLGLAARRLAGRTLRPHEFSGGETSQCFRILRELGFEIVPKPDATPEERPKLWAIALGEGGAISKIAMTPESSASGGGTSAISASTRLGRLSGSCFTSTAGRREPDEQLALQLAVPA